MTDFLLRRAFPQPPEAIETHMSWVFLTRDRAYKLKKPVEQPFFDHRRIDARRRDCEAEVELNRVLAPGVYLAAVPLTCERDGALAIDGGGEVVDWLVVMRRLAKEAFLDHRLTSGSGSVSASEIDALVGHLTDFYRTTDSVPTNPQAYRNALSGILEIDRAELLRHNHAVDSAAVSDLTDRLSEAIGAEVALDARCWRVVDGHGDLRPEHVLLEPEPLVIDRITFDRRLRLVDPLSDLALLAVECERLGAPAVGDDLTLAYLDATGDSAEVTTIALYRSLRATTRARLSVAHLIDSDRDASKWLDRTDAYLAIANRHLDRARPAAGVLRSRGAAGR